MNRSLNIILNKYTKYVEWKERPNYPGLSRVIDGKGQSSPSIPQGGSLFLLSPKRTQLRLTLLQSFHPLSGTYFPGAGDSSGRKSTVCGITGCLSTTADPLPIISSTPESFRGS
jgi:hypothetical protein